MSKFVTSLNYTDKILIVLSAASGGVSIFSHANDNIIGKYIGIVSSTFIVVFSLVTGVIKGLLVEARKNKKKHSKIIMLDKSGLNKIETLIIQALIGLKIDHEEFKIIADEKEKYDQMKENITNTKNKDDISENI